MKGNVIDAQRHGEYGGRGNVLNHGMHGRHGKTAVNFEVDRVLFLNHEIHEPHERGH